MRLHAYSGCFWWHYVCCNWWVYRILCSQTTGYGSFKPQSHCPLGVIFHYAYVKLAIDQTPCCAELSITIIWPIFITYIFGVIHFQNPSIEVYLGCHIVGVIISYHVRYLLQKHIHWGNGGMAEDQNIAPTFPPLSSPISMIITYPIWQIRPSTGF